MISLADLPPELIKEIVRYGLHNDADALLGLVSTCRYLFHTLWPLYAAARWERFRDVLTNRKLVELSVNDDDDNSDDDSDDDSDSVEYETDTSDESSDGSEDSGEDYEYVPKTYDIVGRVHTGQAHPYRPAEDPFTTTYTRVVIRLYNAYGNAKTHSLLLSFLRRAHSIASLVIDCGDGVLILPASALIRAGSQLPGVELTIRGNLSGHQDWLAGPYNPMPALPTGKPDMRDTKDYANALRRPPTVDIPPLAPSYPSQISSLSITRDSMFYASIYPLTLSLLTSPALTSLTLHAIDLDVFNWSQILLSITLPSLSDLVLTRLELSAEDLVPFLARHSAALSSLDLTHTIAHAMTLRLLSTLSLPLLSSLRGDAACLVPLLQSYIHTHTHTGGRGALSTLGISFPVRLALALRRAMPELHEIPPELDDLAIRDLSDFHAVYALLPRFCQPQPQSSDPSSDPNQGQEQGLTTLELENLRYNGFVEWVLSSSSSSSPSLSPPLSFPSIKEIVITDGDLLIRRGTVFPLAQWMGKHSPAWRATQVSIGIGLGIGSNGVSRSSLPTNPNVQEMVRMFFSVIFPGMVSLQYKMVTP